MYNLVVSNKFKYVYFSIPKNATTSIKKYLERYTTIDIGSLTLNNGYNIEYNYEWDKYFKFSIIRNPWDRILSCFLDKTKQCIGQEWELDYYKQYYEYSFEEFIDKLTEKNIMYDGHLMPQSYMIDMTKINFIGRFENLTNDLYFIQQEIGIPKENITHENITYHQNYSDYYDKNSKDKIYLLYKNDIEKFRYEY